MLTPVQQNQYGTPIFIITKKEGTVRFIKDYHKLNRKLVRKPYPLPRIGETMQQLEGFQDTTALDLKRGYYNIRHNSLPMVMCASGDIFQAKVDEIIGDIKGVKMYIDDILVLGQDIFENHIYQLRIIFRRMSAAGLKVNVTKCSFGSKNIPYLCSDFQLS